MCCRASRSWVRTSSGPNLPGRSYRDRQRLPQVVDRDDHGRRTAAFGKGFGCRPSASDQPGIRAGVRKPPKKEPAGERRAVLRLWGFDVAAGLAGDGVARIAGSWKLLMIAD